MPSCRYFYARNKLGGLFLFRLLTNLNACPNNRIPNEAFRNYGLR